MTGYYYDFILDSFSIANTRAWHTDTDFVAFSLKVGDQLYPIQTKFIGDVNNGVYPIGLEFKDILIPNDSTPVAFNYQIINSGHTDHTAIINALSLGAEVLMAQIETGDVWAAIAGGVIQVGVWFGGLLDANCDGPVAIDQWNLSGAKLYEITSTPDNRFVHPGHFPGIDSPSGCGSNSDYWVQFIIKRLWIPHSLLPSGT